MPSPSQTLLRIWPRATDEQLLHNVRVRLLNALALMTGLLGTGSALLSFSINFSIHPLPTIVGLLGPLLLLATPWLVIRTGSVQKIAVIDVLLLYGLLTYQATTMGGVTNQVVFYLCALPVLATILAGTRWGIGIGIVVALTYVGLLAGRDFLPAPALALDFDRTAKWNTITMLFLSAALTGFVVSFQRSVERANDLLDEARKRAENEPQAKASILAYVSYELGNPVNRVHSMAEALLTTELNASQTHHVQIIRQQGENLTRFIEQLLDLSKLEGGTLKLHEVPFNLPELAERVAGRYEPKARDKKVSFKLEVESRLQGVFVGDPKRIGQILDNLISNAVKFTNDGEISIRIERRDCDIKDSLLVLIRVQDTGEGIGSEQAERLFRPFAQAHSRAAREHDGAGLGLAICHKLSEQMGGEMEVSSEPGRGSKFEVKLGVSSVPPPAD